MEFGEYALPVVVAAQMMQHRGGQDDVERAFAQFDFRMSS